MSGFQILFTRFLLEKYSLLSILSQRRRDPPPRDWHGICLTRKVQGVFVLGSWSSQQVAWLRTLPCGSKELGDGWELDPLSPGKATHPGSRAGTQLGRPPKYVWLFHGGHYHRMVERASHICEIPKARAKSVNESKVSDSRGSFFGAPSQTRRTGFGLRLNLTLATGRRLRV